MKARLAPTEDPGDGAEIVQRFSASAARRARAQLRLLHRIDRSRRSEEKKEAFAIHQSAIRMEAALRHPAPDSVKRVRMRIREAIVRHRVRMLIARMQQ